MLPSFIVIGGQRCGTTTLYRLLSDHPQVVRPTISKGTRYFEVGYGNGSGWYQAHFPLLRPGGKVTFESSGYYSFHPLAPERIGRDLPGVKIVMMVRDPVERAYSAYRHEFARGYETETFGRALELETVRLEGEVERLLREPGYDSFSHRHQAYRTRSQYVDQVRAFMGAVGTSNVHVVDADAFFGDPENELAGLFDWLGLHAWVPDRVDQWNARPGSPLDPGLRQELEAHFESFDADLASLLGRPLSWR